MTKGKNERDDNIVEELREIKKLLIFALINDGVSQDAIAKALNLNQSSISRLFPKKK
jgi:hypothetical protein